jgi:hypothetical protein
MILLAQPSAQPAEVAASPARVGRAVFLRLIVMNLSKLNRTLTFREAEIKNAF